MAAESESTDVLIIGGGPVGLLLGYALRRMNISTCIIERLDKGNMPMYGRACTLFPRTIEMLDQLELLDQFNQIGVIARNSVSFKDGQRVTTRGWHHMFAQMGETFHNYLLNIRLKYSEHLIQEAYERLGGRIITKWELLSMTWDSEATNGYGVQATIGAVGGDERKLVISKYIVGSDGGSSTVRQLAGIPFPADSTTYNWVRIDGLVKTDLPDSRVGFGSIESHSHGNVLWVAIDHGRSRVGFALSEDLVQKYGKRLTQEQAVVEAKAAVSPFTLEFEQVDWHTTYSIRQAIADSFVLDNRVVLAGDACHLHSSAAAQGMNTGVHDAVNLAWKLGGVVHGWYRPDILQTYADERQSAARHLIQLDRDYAALISGSVPDHFSSDTSPDALLTQVLDGATQFNIGLGVHYGPNILNRAAEAGMITPGWRAPDGLLYAPGPRIPLRLHTLTPNTGAFWIIVFAGEPLLNQAALNTLRSHLDSSESFIRRIPADAVSFLTVIAGTKTEGAVALGVQSFGKFYFDPDGSSHVRYGFTPENGGIAVLRPDGILGYAAPIGAVREIDTYFESFVSL